MNRRELFSSFGEVQPSTCTPGTRCMRDLIPNALFRTHEGEEVRFYDDIIADKQVMIMMMYADCDTFCPAATMRMVEVHHQHLSERMGKDLFMCNITLKPEQDDPAALEAYAYMHDALLPGWTFLTGNRYDIDTLRYAFFRHDHIGIDEDTDLHAGMMKIVNDSINRWVHADVFATTRTLLDHISWTNPPRTLEQRLEDNRKLQEEINKDVDRHGFRKTV